MLIIDECHLLWGDVTGYVWGRTDEEIVTKVVNERDKQTYYGAVDYLDGKLLLKAYNAGNSNNTIDYLRYLLDQSPNQRLLLLWDGASYHRSHLVQNFLGEVNQGLSQEQWKIHCIRFAPNCPSQNPLEDIWLQAKTWVRRFCALIPTFRHLKWMFEWFLRNTTFDFLSLFRCTELFQKSNTSPIALASVNLKILSFGRYFHSDLDCKAIDGWTLQ